MRKILMTFVISIIVVSLTAGYEQPDPQSQFLCSDRIRNVIAVDDSPNQRFLAATFGLDNYDEASTDIPQGKEAKVISFTVVNTFMGWYIDERSIVSMNQNELNWGNGEVSSYNQADEDAILLEYDQQEFQQRVGGATGFWASPVLYNNNSVILLNKSGTLFSISSDFSNGNASTNWRINLRELERADIPESYKLEYMATPTLIGDYLYVLGLHNMYIINAENGDLVNPEGCVLINDATTDHFIAPLAYDTSTTNNRHFYAISKENKIFVIDPEYNVTQISQTASSFDNCVTAPLVDNSGHIYFTGADSDYVFNNSRFDFLSQHNRTSESNNTLAHVSNTSGGEYKGTIITDRHRGLYFFSDDTIDYYEKEYVFDGFAGSLEFDPLQFSEATTQNLPDGYRYVNNHAAVLERADLFKSVTVTVNNVNEQTNYYPNELEEMQEDRFSLSYYATLPGYSSVGHDFFTHLGPQGTYRTWGGISPYRTQYNEMNVILGDESGYLISYNLYMPILSDIGPAVEVGNEAESVNPPLGNSKFQKGKDNVVNYETRPSYKVRVRIIEDEDPVTHIYLNSYGKVAEITTLANGDSVYYAEFENLLKHPKYTLTLLTQNENGEYSWIQYEDVDIEEDGEIIVDLNNELHVYETDGLYVIDESGLIYNKIVLHQNAQLMIASFITVETNKLEIGNGASIILDSGSLLEVNMALCESPSNTASIEALNQGSVTGQLKINHLFDVIEGSKLKFEGINNRIPSFDVEKITVKANAEVEFLSQFPVSQVNNSARIGIIENGGKILINDCVKVDEDYKDYYMSSTDILLYEGLLSINYNSNFGHLIFDLQTDTDSILIRKDFSIGYAGMVGPDNAQLTINSVNLIFNSSPTTVARSYIVYGQINILNSGQCIADNSTELSFKEIAVINLNGGIDQYNNGAQLTASNYGIIRFAPGVEIAGRMPAPGSSSSYSFGDRITTTDNGEILGTDPDNSRKLVGLNISSTNPNNLRWEGLSINKDYGDENFELSNSQISGVDKIYVKYPGEETIISEVDFSNCKYGVFSDTSFENEQLYKILDCTFEDCDYGIYLEDKTPSDTTSSITAIITDCNFGNDDYISGFNRFGLALKSTENVSINGCNFYRNGYGIFNIQSTILVGGHYTGTNDITIASGTSNNFYNNEKAGIYFGQSVNTEFKSLVYQNTFSGNNSNQSVASGTGIWADESTIDIVDNDFFNLGGHGMLMKTYNWNTGSNYHGFAVNNFDNNKGCELVGDPASLSNPKDGSNSFIDNDFIETNIKPINPFESYEDWDKYILASISDGSLSAIPNLTGNYIEPTPSSVQERFFPSYKSFIFDNEIQNMLSQIIATGVDQFYEGLFDQSIVTMKQAVEVYPDSSLTKLAIDYLYLATRASSEDYSNLRSYLDLKIPTETLATYIKKEEVKTKCYVKEEDYITAISRLQLILDNPETVADSIFALIDQAYCYMNLANQGSKALPDVSVKTPDFASYMDFLYDLSLFSEQNSFNNQLIPPVLNIESNYPNPFNPETSIGYSIPVDGKVVVTVYNLKGQKVKQLLNDHVIAGRHKVIWDGRNSQGQYVSSGLYFVKIKHSNMHRLHKMMLMK